MKSYKYSTFAVKFGAMAYSTPPPTVQPTRVVEEESLMPPNDVKELRIGPKAAPPVA